MSTGSIGAIKSTEVIDRDANANSVEDPSLRAGETDLLIPVPFGASKVRRSSLRRFYACRSLKVESLVALGAGSVGVVGGAEVINGDTFSDRVEDESLRAGEANLVVPVPGLAA